MFNFELVWSKIAFVIFDALATLSAFLIWSALLLKLSKLILLFLSNLINISLLLINDSFFSSKSNETAELADAAVELFINLLKFSK